MNLNLLLCTECESEFDVTEFPTGKKFRCSICHHVLEIPASIQEETAPLLSEPTPEKAISSESRERPENNQNIRKKTLLEASLLEPKEPKAPSETNQKKKIVPTKTKEKPKPPSKEILSKKQKEKTTRLKKKIETPANKAPSKADGPKKRTNLRKEATKTRRKTERLAKSEVRRELSTQVIQQQDRVRVKSSKKAEKSKNHLIPIIFGVLILVGVIGFAANSFFSKTNQSDTKSTASNTSNKQSQLRKEFDTNYSENKDNIDKLFSLAAWCKENNLIDEQKFCLSRILELDPKHAGALIALGRKKPDEIVENIFDPVFGKEKFEQVQSGYLTIASDKLSKEELQKSLQSGNKIFDLFIKEYGASLAEKGYSTKTLPQFNIAIFASHQDYQDYCHKLEQKRAAKEAGLFLVKKQLLISYPKIETSYGGQMSKKVTIIGNPGELLNTSIFYYSYLKPSQEMMVIPKLNLVAKQHLGEKYFAVLTDHYFVAMQNSDSYVSSLAIKHYVGLLELSYQWIYSRYGKVWGLKEYDKLMGLYIFKNNKEFSTFANLGDRAGILGFYRPWTQQMFTFRAPGDTETENTIIHEGTHMIMHYFTNYRPPDQTKELFWFQEGIAEFFGSWARDRETGGYILEQLNQMRFRSLWGQTVSKSKDPKRKLLPMKDILSLTVLGAEVRSRKEKELKDKLYKQGWGLVHFFMNYDNGKYRKNFHEYVKSYINGTSSWATFVKIFGLKSQKQLDEMEKEFKEYIKSLKRKK